jgi:hypothetical protein
MSVCEASSVALDGSPANGSPAVNPSVTAMANPTRGIGGIGSTRGHSAMVESTRGIRGRGIGSTRGHSAMVKSTRGDFRETTRGIGLTRGEEHQGSRKGILQSGPQYDLAAGSECASIPVADPVRPVQSTKREGRRPGFGSRRTIVEVRLIIRNRRQL